MTSSDFVLIIMSDIGQGEHMNAILTNHKYNELFNKMTGVYRIIVKQYDMSECQFWILYALTEEQKPLTQSELMRYINFPKQTIHSAIHKLIDENIILLQEINGNKKSYVLSKQGKELSEKTVQIVIQDEINVFEQFTEEERQQFLSLTQKYIELLESAGIKK